MPPRLPSIAGAAALLVAALPGCRPGADGAANNQAAPANQAADNTIAAPPPAPPILPRETALDREALLLALVRARSAAATGVDDRGAQAELDGKPFAFRIRLGCSFAGTEPGVGRAASYDPETRRAGLSVAPDLSKADPAVAAIAGDAFEAAEGFWIADPWLLAPHCAAGAGGGAGQVGIAQFFTAEDARTGRRDGRPYQANEELPEGASPEAGSWDLVLSGRLRRIGDDRVILCRAPIAGSTPACVISVRFDHVEIRNHRTDRQLAEWRPG